MQSSSASAASSSVPASLSRFAAAAAARRPPGGPFAGLVVCVTGLSKGEFLLLDLDRMVWEVRLLRGSCSSFGDFFSTSAEARGQVKEAAERLGGEYSGSLHPKCTHLVVQISLTRNIQFLQNSSTAMSVSRNSGLHHDCFLNAQHSFAGRKFEHALKHGPRNGLFVVTLGWFVDCVRRNSKTVPITTSPCSVLVT
jgi:hypothetical protein